MAFQNKRWMTTFKGIIFNELNSSRIQDTYDSDYWFHIEWLINRGWCGFRKSNSIETVTSVCAG